MNDLRFLGLLALGVLLATGSLRWCSSRIAENVPAGRFAPLDGLRGLAAFAVFFDHASYWRTLSSSGIWETETPLAWSVGSTAVSIFFMTTAFLFVEKVVFSTRPTDWTRLYVSRALRMMPLFLAALLVLLSIVWAESAGLNEPVPVLISNIARWVPLTLFGTPDINRFPETSLLVAHVTWTLPYECFFYLALPLIALCNGRRVGTGVVVFGSLTALAVFFVGIASDTSVRENTLRLAAFPAGAAAAVLGRSARCRALARSPSASAVVLLLIAASVGLGAYRSKFWMVLCPAVAFALIACGNTAFGVLTARGTRLLGQVSYSIYLLHGLFLYLVLGRLPRDWLESAGGYWALTLLLVPVLMLLCWTTYRTIELPGISSTDRCTAWLRRRLHRAALVP